MYLSRHSAVLPVEILFSIIRGGRCTDDDDGLGSKVLGGVSAFPKNERPLSFAYRLAL